MNFRWRDVGNKQLPGVVTVIIQTRENNQRRGPWAGGSWGACEEVTPMRTRASRAKFETSRRREGYAHAHADSG